MVARSITSAVNKKISITMTGLCLFGHYNLGGTKFLDNSIACDKLVSISFLGESFTECIDPLRVYDDDSAYKLNEFVFFGEVPNGDTPFVQLSFGIKKVIIIRIYKRKKKTR